MMLTLPTSRFCPLSPLPFILQPRWPSPYGKHRAGPRFQASALAVPGMLFLQSPAWLGSSLFKSQLTCHFLREVFLDHLIESQPLIFMYL